MKKVLTETCLKIIIKSQLFVFLLNNFFPTLKPETLEINEGLSL